MFGEAINQYETNVFSGCGDLHFYVGKIGFLLFSSVEYRSLDFAFPLIAQLSLISIMLIAIAALCLYPIWYVLIASVSSPHAIATGEVILWPKGFNWDGYRKLINNKNIWVGYDKNSWKTDENSHWHECACSARSDEEAHIPGAAATATTAQTCIKCGYVVTPSSKEDEEQSGTGDSETGTTSGKNENQQGTGNLESNSKDVKNEDLLLSSPETGDDRNPVLYILLVCAALGMMVCGYVIVKKKGRDTLA